MNDHGVEALSKLTHLTKFFLPPNVTDKSMKTVRQLTSLVSLVIEDNDHITSDGIALLTQLKLQHFVVENCGQISGEYLAQFTNLLTLRLQSRCFVFPEKHVNFTFLSSLTNLTLLNLSCCPSVNDKTLQSLSKLTNLTELNISYSSASVQTLQNLTSIQKLIKLSLSHCYEMEMNNWKILTHFSLLQHLDLSACPIVDEQLIWIVQLQRLNSLDLSFCRLLTSNGLAKLSTLTRMTHLSFNHIPNVFTAFLYLTTMSTLYSLCLDSTTFSKYEIQYLLPFTTLTRLSLAQVPLTSESLVHFTQFTNLKSLSVWINEHNASNSQLRFLTSLSHSLQHLSLQYYAIYDEGLPYLNQMTNLKVLLMNQHLISLNCFY